MLSGKNLVHGPVARVGVLDQDFENIDGLFTRVEEREEVLVDSVCLVVINHTNLTGIRKVHHVGVLDVDDIVNRKRDLHAVAIVVAPKYHSLEALYPLLGAGGTIGPEVICAVTGHNSKVDALFVFVGDLGRDAKAEVDLAMREVLVGGVSVVR